MMKRKYSLPAPATRVARASPAVGYVRSSVRWAPQSRMIDSTEV